VNKVDFADISGVCHVKSGNLLKYVYICKKQNKLTTKQC